MTTPPELAWELKERARSEDSADDEYEASDPLTRAFFAARLRLFASVADMSLPKGGAPRILDAGCGDGYLLEGLQARLSGRTPAYYGCDFALTRAVRARGRAAGARVLLANLKSLPFPTGTFDLVTCTDVLEHVEEPHQAVYEFGRILKPGGAMLIAVPHEGWWRFCRAVLLRFPLQIPGHINRLSPSWVRSLLPSWEVAALRHMPIAWMPWALSLHGTILLRKPR